MLTVNILDPHAPIYIVTSCLISSFWSKIQPVSSFWIKIQPETSNFVIEICHSILKCVARASFMIHCIINLFNSAFGFERVERVFVLSVVCSSGSRMQMFFRVGTIPWTSLFVNFVTSNICMHEKLDTKSDRNQRDLLNSYNAINDQRSTLLDYCSLLTTCTYIYTANLQCMLIDYASI